jgi:hypothetical protein
MYNTSGFGVYFDNFMRHDHWSEISSDKQG